MTRWMIMALALGAAPLAAQDETARQDSLMQEAVRLATEGQMDSAKAIIQSQLDALPTYSNAYAHVLYTAGLVSDTADAAEQYFRRVSIEYSESPWADRSLLRLGQLAFADGELTAARRYTDRVLLDYPTSPVRAEAAFWAGRSEFDLNNPNAGCRYMEQAQREAGDNIEIGNRAGFHLQRCRSTLGIDPVDPAATDSAAVGEDPEERAQIYAVQVAAVSTASAADATMQALRARGYTARVFRDQDGLLKVRVGQFTRRQDAEALARELQRLLGDGPFVVEARQ